jgi:hypothetical protein
MATEHDAKAGNRVRDLWVAALAVVLLTGCAGSARQLDPFTGERASTLRVDVQNNNFNDATIYYTQLGGPERRVGDVVGNGRRSFTVPLDFTGDVRFRIALLADGWCMTHPVVVGPGEVIGLQIVPDFPGAANCESVGGQ